MSVWKEPVFSNSATGAMRDPVWNLTSWAGWMRRDGLAWEWVLFGGSLSKSVSVKLGRFLWFDSLAGE